MSDTSQEGKVRGIQNKGLILTTECCPFHYDSGLLQ